MLDREISEVAGCFTPKQVLRGSSGLGAKALNAAHWVAARDWPAGYPVQTSTAIANGTVIVTAEGS